MQRGKTFFRWLTGWLLLSILGAGMLGGAGLSVRAAPEQQATELDVIINEIAWGGTIAEPGGDEWIELYNPGISPVDLNQWLLISEGSPPNTYRYYCSRWILFIGTTKSICYRYHYCRSNLFWSWKFVR